MLDNCGGKWRELFPSKFSFVVFVTYMALFINQGIMVTASREKGKTYAYNTVMVVLVTECCKLVISFWLYVKEHGVGNFFPEIRKNIKVFILYLVPSVLYCAYNNLSFVNLANFDPTTYFLLLQFRVVVTGVIFQVLFKKKLSRMQWFSLLLLTAGCITKELGRAFSTHATMATVTLVPAPPPPLVADPQLPASDDVAYAASPTGAGVVGRLWAHGGLLLILVQVVCSCFAGVYNEYLLKDGGGGGVPLMLQNFFMYADSIVCNVALLLATGQPGQVFAHRSVAALLQPYVIGIIVNNAVVGIVTSLFLASLNSILKTFASALELVFTAALCWLLFDIAVDAFTAAAIVVVSAAMLLYVQHPVANSSKVAVKVTKDADREGS